MRWCSRCAAGLVSACLGGSEIAAMVCGSKRPLAAHPASPSATATGPATRRHRTDRLRCSLANASPPPLFSCAAPLLDEPEHAHTAALQPCRGKPRRRKAALIALGDGH